MTVGEILTEPLVVHNLGGNKVQRLDAAKALMERVGLKANQLNRYPHEFSGGQRQRICIARALMLRPEFVICDESVSALDVSIQAQVLNLLLDLQQEFKLTYIFISHDLGVVNFISDDVGVMYAGKLLELDRADRIYQQPQEDYTRTLLAAIPKGNPRAIEALVTG
jgi:peptide/nickel transport system ATP-binding protein